MKLDLVLTTLDDYIDYSEREGGRYEEHEAIREAKVWLIEYIKGLKEWTQHEEDCPCAFSKVEECTCGLESLLRETK